MQFFATIYRFHKIKLGNLDVYSLEYCYKEAKLFTNCMLWYASYVFSA